MSSALAKTLNISNPSLISPEEIHPLPSISNILNASIKLKSVLKHRSIFVLSRALSRLSYSLKIFTKSISIRLSFSWSSFLMALLSLNYTEGLKSNPELTGMFLLAFIALLYGVLNYEASPV